MEQIPPWGGIPPRLGTTGLGQVCEFVKQADHRYVLKEVVTVQSHYDCNMTIPKVEWLRHLTCRDTELVLNSSWSCNSEQCSKPTQNS